MKAKGEFTVENFAKHDKENPHIWNMFVKYTLEVAQKRDYFSAKAVFHRIRWETAISEYDSDFKISDGWISHYARKFMKEYPQYDGFFKTQKRRVSYFEEDEWELGEQKELL